jgi:uncharacterized membrane protein YcaP (DUF421 family)
MMDSISGFLSAVLGLDTDSLSAGQIAARAVITFVVTVVIVRSGDKRLFGKATAFDFIVSIMIGSIMSRAITDPGPLWPTWLAGAVLIGLHWLLATLAFHLDWFGPVVKGNSEQLVEDGRPNLDGMRQSGITRNELEQALRVAGQEPDLSSVKAAYLERDGSISVIPRPKGPRILDVSVADGVQTVRIALE